PTSFASSHARNPAPQPISSPCSPTQAASAARVRARCATICGEVYIRSRRATLAASNLFSSLHMQYGTRPATSTIGMEREAHRMRSSIADYGSNVADCSYSRRRQSPPRLRHDPDVGLRRLPAGGVLLLGVV